jgi:hypothetical protein
VVISLIFNFQSKEKIKLDVNKPKDQKEKYYTNRILENLPREGMMINLYDNSHFILDDTYSKYGKSYHSILVNEEYSFSYPATDFKHYFPNGFLLGFKPYEIKSIWLALEYIRTRLKYQLDTKFFKRPEIWQTSKQSFVRLRGDCEDSSILLADWLINLGYDARVVIGEAKDKQGKFSGHAWVVLFKDGKEYLLESTSKRKIKQLPFAHYFINNYRAHAMFNDEYIWINKEGEYIYSNWEKTAKFLKKVITD